MISDEKPYLRSFTAVNPGRASRPCHPVCSGIQYALTFSDPRHSVCTFLSACLCFYRQKSTGRSLPESRCFMFVNHLSFYSLPAFAYISRFTLEFSFKNTLKYNSIIIRVNDGLIRAKGISVMHRQIQFHCPETSNKKVVLTEDDSSGKYIQQFKCFRQ